MAINNADDSINFDVKINTDGLAGEVNKVSSAINKVSNNKTLTAFAKLGASVTGLQSAFSMVTNAVKKANEVVKETTTLYKAQTNAEKQLEIAVKNNPYLTDSAATHLKNYASQLQSISTVGDEQLIPMMAQLAASGRTEEQIQTIMSAALDVSASGMMSLDSAVQQLNSSYSGSVGLLGRQISELKNLTTEELASGKAVEIIGQKFKGMAEETAKATGSSEQLSNAIGDMKEEIGATFEKKLSPMRQFFTELISGWTDAAKAKREYNEAAAKAPEQQDTSDLEKLLAHEEQVLEEMQNGYGSSKNTGKKTVLDQIKESIFISATGSAGVSATSVSQGSSAEIEAQKQVIRNLKEQIRLRQQSEKAAAQQQAAATEQATKEKTATDAYVKFLNTINDAQDSINQRRAFGEDISKDEELQEMLNVKTQAYVQLLKDAQGTITGNSEREKAFVQSINDDYQKLAEIQARTQKNEEVSSGADSLISAAQSYTDNTKDLLSTQIDAEITLLDEYIEELKAAGEEYQEFTDKRTELEKLQTAVVKKEAEEQQQATLESVTKSLETVNDYISQFSEITSSLSDIIVTNSEKQTDAELTAISEQYTDGLISYEEFCEKKGEINKKAKQEEYKAELWEYYANLASAIANVAVGVTKAIASSAYPLNLINAGLVSASGAIQIASLTANKPTAPSFATGGVVQGGNYNDGITAHLSSGEMILNSAQQMNLWKMANSGSSGNGSVNMPVTVVNNNGSNIKTSLSAKGLKIVVDSIVNSSAANGTYTNAFNNGNSVNNGLRYL